MRVFSSQIPGSRTHTQAFQRLCRTLRTQGQGGGCGALSPALGVWTTTSPRCSLSLTLPSVKWKVPLNNQAAGLPVCVQICFYSTQFRTSRLQYDPENLKLTFICPFGQACMCACVPAGSAPAPRLWLGSRMVGRCTVMRNSFASFLLTCSS